MDYKILLQAVIDSSTLASSLKAKITEIEAKGGNILNVKTSTNFKDVETATIKWQDGLTTVNTKMRDIDGKIKDVDTSTVKVGKSTSFWETSLGTAVSQLIKYQLGLGLIYKLVGQIQQGFQYVIDLNKEMVNIQVLQVPGASTPDEINALARQYNNLAREMGATTIEVAQGSTEWLRQGKTIEETGELLKATLHLAKLGALDTATATEDLTAILNGFNMEAERADEVVSKLVAIDNIAATSAGKVLPEYMETYRPKLHLQSLCFVV